MYTARCAERKPGLDKSQGCWRCIILYYALISLYNQKYKRPFWTIEDASVTGKTGFPRVESLSLPFSPSPSLSFSGWIPIWSMEAHQIYLLALASKTNERGSPRRGTLRYSNRRQWPNIDGTSSLSGFFLVFHVNQVIQPLFSTNFPTILFLLNLFLYFWISKFFLAYSVSCSNYPGSTGAGPRQHAVIHGVAKSWTWLSDWTELNWTDGRAIFQSSSSIHLLMDI